MIWMLVICYLSTTTLSNSSNSSISSSHSTHCLLIQSNSTMSCRNRSIQDQDHAYKEEIQLLLRQTDRLCKLCQNVFDKWNRVLEQLKADELNKTITRMIFHHHGSPEALETAAEEGCGLCGQFVSSNEKEPREPTKTGFQSDVTYVQFDESDINGTPDKGQLGMLFLWFDWQILPGLGGLTLKIP